MSDDLYTGPPTPKSTLLDKTGKLIGFAFNKHPLYPGCFMHVVIYQVGRREFCACLSQGSGKGKPELMRPHLGETVPGASFAQFAERFISGVPLRKMKRIFKESMPDAKFEWM